jgi:hypothetical protein
MIRCWLVLCVAACGGGPGDGKACDPKTDSVICLDSQTRLACEDKVWHAESCLGPKGCEAGALFVSCDVSLSTEASACSKEDNLACTTDKHSMLRCRNGKWQLTSKCHGPKGCDAVGFFITCDTSIVVEGEPCDNGYDQRNIAGCSADMKSRLVCNRDRWKKDQSCLGPRGCYRGLGVSCDGPTASPGDFCIKGERADHACTPDRKHMVVCEAEGWKIKGSCRGGCTSSALGVECRE